MLNFNDVERMARDRTLDCLCWLLPDGKLQGEEFRAINPTRYDRKTGSFSYNVRKHLWSDFATNDKGGGIIGLWCYVRNLSYMDAAKELVHWLGINSAPHESDFFRKNIEIEKAAKVAKDAKLEKWIAQLWQQSDLPQGTAVETYLHSRELTGAIPPTIRHVAAHKHCDTGLLLPIMLAAVTVWPSKKVTALHRTFLKLDGTGKAPVTSNKKMIGQVAGGAARLAPAAETMAVGEGIETCLAVQQISNIPTWAALSTSGLINLTLPDLPLGREIIIAVDNDDAGKNAAQKAAARWINEGRKVRLAIPQDTKDFNDLLRMP